MDLKGFKEEWRELHKEKRRILNHSPNRVKMNKCRTNRMEKGRSDFKTVKSIGKRLLGGLRVFGRRIL